MADVKDSDQTTKDEAPLILVVDDTSKNIEVLGTILDKEGYRISAAMSGEQALAILGETDPDLILLDVMMPDMDGYEVCRRIKMDEAKKSIPVIFLTAKTAMEDIVKGFDAGGVDYISKPFHFEVLVARVRTHVELYTRKKELVKKTAELQNALDKVKLLSGIIPICSYCKKIRNDKGYWSQVEEYIRNHSEAEFSHSLCPDCLKEQYPGIAEQILRKLEL
jgi:PleD family two-component response regulator